MSDAGRGTELQRKAEEVLVRQRQRHRTDYHLCNKWDGAMAYDFLLNYAGQCCGAGCAVSRSQKSRPWNAGEAFHGLLYAALFGGVEQRQKDWYWKEGQRSVCTDRWRRNWFSLFLILHDLRKIPWSASQAGVNSTYQPYAKNQYGKGRCYDMTMPTYYITIADKIKA